MRRGFLVLLLVTMLFGGSYWFYVAEAVCAVPIVYRIGTVDPRFNISNDAVRMAVTAAESMWEDATGRNLFTYDPKKGLPINFIFDERQAKANEEEALRQTLETKEGVSDSVRTQYDSLVKEYDALRVEHQKRTSAYEAKLEAYNKEVNDWNARGGAPEDVFERLKKTQDELATEQKKLNTVAGDLNALVRKMNALSAKGNSLVTDYNQVVEEYNSKFSEGEEFTQGDYEGKVINIYQYDSPDELDIVLAHELGHALSLDHVEGETSIMYHLMEKQSKETGITAEDLAEFDRVCGPERPFIESMRMMLRRFI